MRLFGEICLLASLVATGYAAFLSIWRAGDNNGPTQRLAATAALVGLIFLTSTMAILVWALVARDFRFDYVAQYSSRLLPWQYCVAALWVGQAGSLLLWAWMTNIVAALLRLVPTPDQRLRNMACGLVMANVCFLVIVMVFAADPMAASLIGAEEGAGLNPLLQHPSMLIHPPIVFLAYAASSVPCALSLATLMAGRADATWGQMARPWAIVAWMLLGAGLLLGAHWAYQELGWGGYWGWDPVENGSLMPWLTGTALIHSLMAWRHREQLKKTALMLAILTFALCNFATFLTRSGVFSSVHAFSQSPIGWLFLALMSVLLFGGMALLVRRRQSYRAERQNASFFARETLILVSNFLLLALTVVVLIGTSVAPVSKVITGRMMLVGPEFYNNVLPPIGLGLLGMTAVVPLLRWGAAPTAKGRKLLLCCLAASSVVMLGGFVVGLRRPAELGVAGLASLSFLALVVAWVSESMRRDGMFHWQLLFGTLRNGQRKYAAYSIHLGFVVLAVGITGSSLGTQQQELTLAEGDVVQWAGQEIHYRKLEQRQAADKLIAEAVLEVGIDTNSRVEIRPARHLHVLQNQWTTEVAIYSTWRGDLYTVLNAGLGDGEIALTVVYNPMMRWIWIGGIMMTSSAMVVIWPSRRRRRATVDNVQKMRHELKSSSGTAGHASAA